MISNHSIDVEAERKLFEETCHVTATNKYSDGSYRWPGIEDKWKGWLAAKRSIPAAPICPECRDRPRFKSNWLDLYHDAPEVSASPVPLASGNTNNESSTETPCKKN